MERQLRMDGKTLFTVNFMLFVPTIQSPEGSLDTARTFRFTTLAKDGGEAHIEARKVITRTFEPSVAESVVFLDIRMD